METVPTICLVSPVDKDMVSISNAAAAGVLMLAGSPIRDQLTAVGGLLTFLQLAVKEDFTKDYMAELFRDFNYRLRTVYTDGLDKFFCSSANDIKAFCGNKTPNGFVSLQNVSPAILDMMWLRRLRFIDMIAYAGVITLFIAKDVPNSIFNAWLKSRLKYFWAALEAPIDVDTALFTLMPSFETYQNIYNFFSRRHLIRMQILSMLFSLKVRNDTWAILAKAVLIQLKGIGMHHFSLINTYIFFNNSYLLHWGAIKGYLDHLFEVYTCLEEVEPNISLRPYYILLQPPEDCQFLNGCNFEVLTAIALEIRRQCSVTHSNCGNASSTSEFVRQLVYRSVNIIKGIDSEGLKNRTKKMSEAKKHRICSVTGNFEDLEDQETAIAEIEKIFLSPL